ncbi:MAG: hypothetical protein HQL66_15570 [Magnetococcales bacterium]|nr:hypothetical protein [Magnetococcales bacterium]
MADDPDRETLGRLLAAWNGIFGNAPTMVREAVNAMHSFTTMHETDEREELREVIRDIADERGQINRRRLGRWITRHAGRIVDGLKFVPASGNMSAKAWRVESVSSVLQVFSSSEEESVTTATPATSDSPDGSDVSSSGLEG